MSDLMEDLVLSPGQFWGALGIRATGAAIVTAMGPEGPAGFLALSATHLAAAPPIMTVSVSPTTSALAAITASGAFAINYLSASAEGRAIYDRFTAKDAPKGAERFAGLATTTLSTGAPVFLASTGALDCRLEEVVDKFGTSLIFGRIVNTARHEAEAPLIHFAGKLQG